MAKTVQIVTTKPAKNQAEYAIRDGDILVLHGEVMNYTLGDLNAEQLSALNAARQVLQELAEADAAAKGLT